MAGFPVHPGRTALVIVDMQHCFVAGSPIAAPHGVHVAERLKQLATACRQSGFAEVVSVDEVLSRIPAAVTAAAEA